MDYKKLNRIFAAIIFIIAALTYFSTVQPSVSFWDCGEFVASSDLMQVPHPPGTPLFLLLGRVMTLIPFAANLAFRVNTISVLASSFTIMFLYLIGVRVIESFKGRNYKSLLEATGTYLAAGIGALSLAFSDTFWFNAAEAEVYASATFFIAIVVWLMMVWYRKADEPDNEKYLLMIAYLIGLATGVHLMSLLAIPSVVMIIMFRKYVDDDEKLKYTGKLFVIHSAIILLIAIGMWASQTGQSAPDSATYNAFDRRMVLIFLTVSVIFMGVFWKKIFNKNSFYLPIIFGGIALLFVYPGIVKYITDIITRIGGNNTTLDVAMFIGLIVVIGYVAYWANKSNKQTLNLIAKSALFALIGFTTYSMIIIRANQDPPINMNNPKNFPDLVSYLNRAQYGDFPTFQRRFSQEPNQRGIYTNYSSDLDFFWRYQMNHMFHRYLLWNYVGRTSTVQDANYDWTEFFYIPFLLGLFGLYYHFRKDWKMASIFLVMFIFLGYLTAFYQNQQQPQPRERDYFYVGAFFVYSLWIALGVRGLLDLVVEQFKDSKLAKVGYFFVLIFGILLVPVNMFFSNYFDHDRSKNYVPWDYSYNLLQSVAPNAILFTNGDNDTFPLWYLQDVEGVRRDVRIANLSLLNTGWYIDQLKNTTPFGTKEIKMTLSERDIADIGPQRWKTQKIAMPVSKETFKKFGVTDTSVINKGKIEWTMKNTLQFGTVKAIKAQDITVLSMIMANQFERPIYFAVTVSDDSRIGLNSYMQMEGMAYRLTPKKGPRNTEYINEKIMREDLFNEPSGFSKTYQPGFKFRGLNDPSVFLNDNHKRLVQNYRNSFMRLALYYLYQTRNYKMVVNTLNEMEKKIPRNIIPIDYRLLHDIASIYSEAGDKEQAKILDNEVIPYAINRIKTNPRDFQGRYSPYLMLIEIYQNNRQYNKAIDILRKLQQFAPNDPSIKSKINSLQQLAISNQPEVKKKTLQIDSTKQK